MTRPSTRDGVASGGPVVRGANGQGGERELPGAQWIPELPAGTGRYRLRFARTQAELDAACRLRFEVFNIELNEGLPESYESGLDRDEFDEQCQHLLVLDSETDTVVGTYRMQVAEAATAGKGFYSAGEYDFSTLPDEALSQSAELGRACVARSHRSKHVLFLLWRGVIAYVRANECPLVFGCSSLTSQDPQLAADAYLHIKRRGWLHPRYHVDPLPEFVCPAPEISIETDAETARARADAVELPTLFSMYMRHGANVVGSPAMDRTFGTIDFLTLMDTRRMSMRLLTNILR